MDKTRKLSKAKLIRSALHYAIAERESYIDADPENGKHYTDFVQGWKQLLMKDYGQLANSDIPYTGETISVYDIFTNQTDEG